MRFAAFIVFTLVLSTSNAQSVSVNAQPVPEVLDDAFHETMNRLRENPNLTDYAKIPRSKQLALMVEAEAGQMQNDNILNKGTYAALAAALYPKIVDSLTPTERSFVDSKVLRQVWTQKDLSEIKLKETAARLFGRDSALTMPEREALACGVAHDGLTTASLNSRISELTHTTATNESLFAELGQLALDRFEKFLPNSVLGAAQHVTCRTDQDSNPLFDLKSLADLRQLSAEYLKMDPSRPQPAARPLKTAANTAKSPATPGSCSLTQLHDSLVDGERLLRTTTSRRHYTITNDRGCGVSGELTRDRDGLLRLQLRAITPGAPTTTQEGKDLSQLVRKVYDWQQRLFADAGANTNPVGTAVVSIPSRAVSTMPTATRK